MRKLRPREVTPFLSGRVDFKVSTLILDWELQTALLDAS